MLVVGVGIAMSVSARGQPSFELVYLIFVTVVLIICYLVYPTGIRTGKDEFSITYPLFRRRLPFVDIENIQVVEEKVRRSRHLILRITAKNPDRTYKLRGLIGDIHAIENELKQDAGLSP